jgi:hypothetical protein
VATRSALVAGGIGFAALIISGVLSALPGVGQYLPPGLWGAADQVAVGNAPDAWVGQVGVSLAIIAVSIALSAWSFRRQEL